MTFEIGVAKKESSANLPFAEIGRRGNVRADGDLNKRKIYDLSGLFCAPQVRYSLFGFYTQQDVNSAANFVFRSKTGLPGMVLPVLQWVIHVFVPEIFNSPLSEFEQRMYSSDPRPDTGSLMQLESRRAVPQSSQPP